MRTYVTGPPHHDTILEKINTADKKKWPIDNHTQTDIVILEWLENACVLEISAHVKDS